MSSIATQSGTGECTHEYQVYEVVCRMPVITVPIWQISKRTLHLVNVMTVEKCKSPFFHNVRAL